jgi:hypothetical protein
VKGEAGFVDNGGFREKFKEYFTDEAVSTNFDNCELKFDKKKKKTAATGQTWLGG